MTDDKELIARLRRMDTWLFDTAADRIEQLAVTNEALTEQLTAARQDAKEAEAYAEELEREQKGWQEAAVKLMNKLTLMTTERDEAWKRAAHAEKVWGECLVKLKGDDK